MTIYHESQGDHSFGKRLSSSHQVHMGLMENSGYVVSRRAQMQLFSTPLYRKIECGGIAYSLSGPKETQISQTPKGNECILSGNDGLSLIQTGLQRDFWRLEKIQRSSGTCKMDFSVLQRRYFPCLWQKGHLALLGNTPVTICQHIKPTLASQSKIIHFKAPTPASWSLPLPSYPKLPRLFQLWDYPPPSIFNLLLFPALSFPQSWP